VPQHDREPRCRKHATEQMDAAKAFYGEVLGMTVGIGPRLDHHLRGIGQASPQISFATEGGSGTPVPDPSIEVDDLSLVHERVVSAGYQPEYGPATEPWGVRRFFVIQPSKISAGQSPMPIGGCPITIIALRLKIGIGVRIGRIIETYGGAWIQAALISRTA